MGSDPRFESLLGQLRDAVQRSPRTRLASDLERLIQAVLPAVEKDGWQQARFHRDAAYFMVARALANRRVRPIEQAANNLALALTRDDGLALSYLYEALVAVLADQGVDPPPRPPDVPPPDEDPGITG